MVQNQDEYETDARDLLQIPVPDVPTVKVDVEGIVRTQELPAGIVTATYKILRGGNPPEKILPRDPRRKLVVIQNLTGIIAASTPEFVMISTTKSGVSNNNLRGALLVSSNALVRYELPWADEMWAQGVEMASSGGVISAFTAPATGDSLLSLMTFSWSH